MSVPGQYTETIRSKAFGTSGTPSNHVDPTVAIDQAHRLSHREGCARRWSP